MICDSCLLCEIGSLEMVLCFQKLCPNGRRRRRGGGGCQSLRSDYFIDDAVWRSWTLLSVIFSVMILQRPKNWNVHLRCSQTLHYKTVQAE